MTTHEYMRANAHLHAYVHMDHTQIHAHTHMRTRTHTMTTHAYMQWLTQCCCLADRTRLLITHSEGICSLADAVYVAAGNGRVEQLSVSSMGNIGSKYECDDGAEEILPRGRHHRPSIMTTLLCNEHPSILDTTHATQSPLTAETGKHSFVILEKSSPGGDEKRIVRAPDVHRSRGNGGTTEHAAVAKHDRHPSQTPCCGTVAAFGIFWKQYCEVHCQQHCLHGIAHGACNLNLSANQGNRNSNVL